MELVTQDSVKALHYLQVSCVIANINFSNVTDVSLQANLEDVIDHDNQEESKEVYCIRSLGNGHHYVCM